MSTKPTIYRPGARERTGLIGAARATVAQLRKWHWHIWIDFKREFNSAQSGAGLGRIWSLLLPLTPLGAYTLLSVMRLFPSRDDMPAAVFVCTGVTVWFLLIDSLAEPVRSLEARHGSISQTSYPFLGVVLSGFGQAVFQFLVRVVALVVVAAAFGAVPSLYALAALPVLLFAVIFFFSIGLVLGVLNLINRDVGNFLRVSLQYLIFFSGAIFPLSQIPQLQFLAQYNPFYIVVDGVRSLVFTGSFDNLTGLMWMGLAAPVMLLIAVRIFYVMEPPIRSLAK